MINNSPYILYLASSETALAQYINLSMVQQVVEDGDIPDKIAISLLGYTQPFYFEGEHAKAILERLKYLADRQF